MYRFSQASKRVINIYKSELNELDVAMNNAIYDELAKESAQGFREGWTEAMVWIRSHPNYTNIEGLEARDSEIKMRYPYLKSEEKK